jgi:hypothetical protein
MAFPSSALSVPTFVDALDTTQLAIDLDLETHKVALFTNSVASPDPTVDTGYAVAPWNANEVTGTNYTAVGVLLTGTTFVHSATGVCVFDASDSTWTTATWSTARGADIYADALAGNNHIAFVNFGADFGVSAGTFTIQWNAGGIFSIDFVP